ncbi:ferritin-like domain-containing protein [Hymenobacter sp. B81]|uniref:ferritin-like domain-containing protein n=1 Tax=Hymenobacter sp. B81 TaxID=3344878 RepID=UPI0037DCDCF0
MDIFQLISDIEKVDPEVYARLDTRRRAFRHLSGMGKKLTAAALPAFFGTVFTKAYGQGASLPAEIVAVLNLALQLEYLEYHFYNTALNAGTLINAADRPALTLIRNDESGHIKVLRTALGSQAFSQADPTAAAFDYTGMGSYADVFTNPATFYGVAQAFVDTGIRAYKGGAPLLMANKDILQAALNIHSVEARHCSHVRTIRRGLTQSKFGQEATTVPGGTAPAELNLRPKSWISGTDNGGPGADKPVSTRPVYGPGAAVVVGGVSLPSPAEDNIIHATINVQTSTTAPGGLTVTTAAASEAFDEPLDAATVKAIARNFRSPLGVSLGLFS